MIVNKPLRESFNFQKFTLESMKTSMIVLYVLVSLCLVFSFTALIVATRNGSLFPSTASNTTSSVTPQPTSTGTQTPTPTNLPGELKLNVKESSRIENGLNKIVYSVTLENQGPNNITVNYSQFYLQLYVSRAIYVLERGTVSPQNSGSITLQPHSTSNIQLIFQFATTVSNGMDYVKPTYALQFSGNAIIR